MLPPPVVLVHGGLYEGADPGMFWGQTGIGAGLTSAGFRVLAPTRPEAPRSWEAERDALIVAIGQRSRDPVSIVAASNGCSAALRAIVDMPDLASRLVLCWPTTAGDPEFDSEARQRILKHVGHSTADRLLAGETIRGLLDSELERVGIPVTIVPSEPDDPFHRQETVARLKRLLPDVRVTEPTPPARQPSFRHHRSRFIAMVVDAIS